MPRLRGSIRPHSWVTQSRPGASHRCGRRTLTSGAPQTGGALLPACPGRSHCDFRRSELARPALGQLRARELRFAEDITSAVRYITCRRERRRRAGPTGRAWRAGPMRFDRRPRKMQGRSIDRGCMADVTARARENLRRPILRHRLWLRLPHHAVSLQREPHRRKVGRVDDRRDRATRPPQI